MTIITRFAPSPTGDLHIGAARTALFNYLFAKHHSGKFLLRIEDTDNNRSNVEYYQSIINSLNWLNIQHDDEVLYQSSRSKRYLSVANDLLKYGYAYYCFCSQKDIARYKEGNKNYCKNFVFRSPWRNVDSDSCPKDVTPVIRLKVPDYGKIIVNDMVQGEVIFDNINIEDVVLIRADGTATYTLASVVDDHDTGITHIIRGDDHLTNTAKQQIIYNFMGWELPKWAHIALIHDINNRKLSKRRGAVGIEYYRNQGYLPEAICNYLLRLGWSHGDDEIISKTEAIKWFNIESMGKSPSIIDFDKMRYLNSVYLKLMDNEEMMSYILNHFRPQICEESKKFIMLALDEIKQRSATLLDVYNLAKIYIIGLPLVMDDEAKNYLNKMDKAVVLSLVDALRSLVDYSQGEIKGLIKNIAIEYNMKSRDIFTILRVLITGRIYSSSIVNIMYIIGRDHSIRRLEKAYYDFK
ncbi:glutamate--tRNA ligase [Rickettsia endosymbiont of Cardiosporidium cionae]|uniref:glutamate--tRNA ligase n=1 Tax=Rickettsia endosymbiont of Cardiosporidium cionae TaxID=2777155 RepID=UPI001893303E|nr:glutamate--tRNA ligase [Rickettsia endosymbiont of Cardiosporidium cionae]KAF8818420.1 glutamate--tRNA ligase [Rickettsia endosymbiont of Cardiosporidium cionae]